MSLSDTVSVLPLHIPMEPQFNRKALFVLRENIRQMLHDRHEDQKTLAEWCGHQKSWLNKFLNEGRGIRVGDFDKVASFFGVEAYQLFQPGISMVSERRHTADRRSGHDRRVGHSVRMLPGLRAELNKMPRLASRGADHGPGAVPPAVASIIAEAERKIAAIYAAESRRQTPVPGKKVASASKGRRGVRGPDPETAG